MADYRFIQIEDEEEEFEDETDETEEFEDEIEDEEDEIEENLIPERINLPVDLNLIDELEDEDDSDYYNDDDDDYDEEEDDGEYLIPEGIIFPVNIDPINQLEDDYSDYDDDDYDDDDDEDYEDEEVEELIPVEMTSPDRVDRSVVMNNVWLDNSNGFDTCDGRKEEVNRCEIDGLICPICFEAWTSGGQHQISCLPCGHIYGLSCIKKWLQQRQSSGKCPQCNSLCTLKDVRVLYASRLCVADEELHKRVRSLEAKCAFLEQKASGKTWYTAAEIDQMFKAQSERFDKKFASTNAQIKALYDYFISQGHAIPPFNPINEDEDDDKEEGEDGDD